MIVLFALAALGFSLSVVTHLLTFLGIAPDQTVPALFLLHLGIFVVWIPMVIVLKKDAELSGNKDIWKVATRKSPVWLRILLPPLSAYTFFNFIYTIFVLNQGGSPSVVNGEKALANHGTIIRKLSDEEYQLHQAYDFRIFSGHWMLFYGVATTVLLSRIRESREAEGADRDVKA